jgi:hypothetical protein
MSQPETPLLRDLYRVLQDEARDDAMQCLKVAVLVAARMPRAEIARRLDVEPKAVEQAIRRLQVEARSRRTRTGSPADLRPESPPCER